MLEFSHNAVRIYRNIVSDLTTLGVLSSVTDANIWSIAKLGAEKNPKSCCCVFINPSGSTKFKIQCKAFSSGQSAVVYWGDSTSLESFLLNPYSDSTVDIGRTWGESSQKIIIIVGELTYLSSTYSTGETTFGGLVRNLNQLKYLHVTGTNTLSGSISGLQLLTLNVQGSNTISGSVSHMTGLNSLTCIGTNTLSGSVSQMTSLTAINMQGNNTISGDVSNLTLLTSLIATGNNTISGSITNLTSLTMLNVQGSNTISGSITNLTSLTYCLVTGSNSISGDLTNVIGLTYCNIQGLNTVSGSVSGLVSATTINIQGSNTVSGSLASLSNLSYLLILGSNTCTNWGSVALSATGMCYFYQGGNTVLTSTEINAILAGFVTNKDSAKPRNERVINIGKDVPSPNGAPTGQGITDSALLSSYRSPTPPGTASYWSVTTN